MVLDKLGNLTDPLTPAECDDRTVFVESGELFVNRCERTNAALNYPNQLQREQICHAYTQDQQRIRNSSILPFSILNPSLCDFQTMVSPWFIDLVFLTASLIWNLRIWIRKNQNRNLKNIHFIVACRDGWRIHCLIFKQNWDAIVLGNLTALI